MSQQKITISHNQGILTIRDVTGLFPGSPEGWGSPGFKRRQDIESCILNVYHNSQPIKELDVTDTVKNSIDNIIILAEFQVDNGDGVYKAFSELDEVTSFGALAFVHDQATHLACRLWARLASLYDSYKYREFAKECIFIDSTILNMDNFMRRGQEKEYINLLRIVKERIELNKKYLKP